MHLLHPARIRRVGYLGVICLLSLFLVPGLALSQGEQEETVGVPGVPPGEDIDSRRGVGGMPQSATHQKAALKPPPPRDGKFHLVEATIDDIHKALQRRELTCTGLVKLYFKRIKAYSGQCVKYDKDGDGDSPDYDFYMPSGKGVYLGVVSPIVNAGQINAIQSLNLRPVNYTALGFAPPHDPGPRSETDLIDSDPNLPDALEVAAQLDREFQPHSIRPLHCIPIVIKDQMTMGMQCNGRMHCIPIVIKDQMETIDMRTTDGSLTQFEDDRPPNDGALVAKLRAAGAVIIGKANMDEYAGGTHRSSYAGQMCNPYATDRDAGSSSTGSATAVAANLAVCGIAEESLGSVREPGAKTHVVAMTPTRGLVSRFGTWGANLIRERFGPECRTVGDLAKVLDVIRGYDPKDPITATQVGYTPTASLATFASEQTLRGKRLGIIREFMPNITVNDTDSIRVFNEEVIPTLRAAGATLLESINPRDITKGWAVDDLTIPNMNIQGIITEMLPTLDPSFANASTVPSPSSTTGLLPNILRQVFDPVGLLFPPGTDIIGKSVEMFFVSTSFPEEINLRKLDTTPPGSFNQGRYALDNMLVRRNDPQVKSVLDLSIDFDDLDDDGNTTEHISFFRINDDATGTIVQRNRPGVDPGVGVPATPSGLTLDTQGEATHLFRMQAIREIVARIMADYKLDALVYPYETIPPKILTGTSESIAWLAYDGRPNRGINGFTDVSGLPDIGVPAGFTRVVYDRTTRGAPSEALALTPPAMRREVALPVSVQFLGRPWSEPVLLEIASAYEKARGPRTPPPDFGPLPGEP